ncbi:MULTISPECIES: F0F1 ATP synthase subunit delta [Paenibacillus]|uniref:ATP synthase subunit delta n=1 Tax=Paenibacillus radicis (ex Xue et al. 2023) TaxID=2972489 RepID=A0ABT1YGJ3_9BACL|nr:F0F1 ATP synthase subunit delta [Paenibacillus radicis (ex Xue et al. 2023)]MCR8632320.1 F0F1 ATP synthase subunit delta [Paenibacillus radicis (ex Xue et al. 2023)]
MSQDTVVAKRYARALFELAQEQNKIAAVEEELKAVVSVMQDNTDFEKLIKHPGLGAESKTALLKNVFESQLSEITFNTLLLLVEKGREDLLEALVNYYVTIASDALGQAQATVYTPVELSEADLSHISATFSNLTGKQIRVVSVLDKSLLGGIKVRIGDRLYDGSLSGKLERLEKTLNQTQAL